MTDLVEVLARALCETAGHDPDGPTCDVYVPGDPVAGIPWAGYRGDARAILSALEAAGYCVVPVEPTVGMIEKNWDLPVTLEHGSYGWVSEENVREIWAILLAAAPKTGEPTAAGEVSPPKK